MLRTTTRLTVTRLLSSEARSTWLTSMKVRSSLTAPEPLSMTPRRSLSAPASVVLNRARFEENVRIAETLSSCPVSTVFASRMSAVVMSKLSLAVSMNEFEVSMIWARSSPVPSKALPSSLTVVRRSSWSTLETEFEMFSGRLDVDIGIFVSARSTSEVSGWTGQVLARAIEGLAELADRRAQVVLVDAGDRVRDVLEQLGRGNRDLRVCPVDLGVLA